jgi:hypothetical protein
MGQCVTWIQKAAEVVPRGSGREKILPPDTDSKQPGRQGQPRQAEFLWIREAGIPLIEKCMNPSKLLAIFEIIPADFPHPEIPRASPSPAAFTTHAVMNPSPGNAAANALTRYPRLAGLARRI